MKRVLVILLVLSGGLAKAQNPEIDSLNRLIGKAGTPAERIELLVKKIGSLNEVNLDSAIALGTKTIGEAQRANYPLGEAKTRIKLANSYSFKGEFGAARQNLLSAGQTLRPLGDLPTLSDLYGSYGMLYGMQSKYDSSATYFLKAIRLSEQTGSTKRLGNLYQNVAISYQMQANHQRALVYFQKALKLAEAAKNLNSQSYVLVNLGITYAEMGDLDRVEPLLTKAIRLARQVGIKNVELYAYSNLASHYEIRKKFGLAYDVAMKAATLGGQMGDKGIQAASLAKASSALRHQHKLEQAEALARQALAIAGQANQPLVSYQTNASMGSVQKDKGAYQAALSYFEKGFGFLTNTDLYETAIGEAYLDASLCYEKTGNYSRALTAYKAARQIADSVRSKENIRKVTELSLNYNFEKKQELARAERQKEKDIARIRQLALLAGLVLTLIVAVVAFVAFRAKQRANVLLNQQKEQIERTLAELKTTQRKLIEQEKMASLGELTAGIAHEIQNPLNFVNNFAEVSAELCQELRDELDKSTLPQSEKMYLSELISDLVQNQGKIVHHGRRADSIVKNMLQHSRTSAGVQEPTDLNALADEYLRLAYHGFRRPGGATNGSAGKPEELPFNAMLTTDFDPAVGQVSLVPQEIGRVLLNLYTNAFYATQQQQRTMSLSTGTSDPATSYQPQVWVSTRLENGQVKLKVRDNGTGIPKAVMGRIYQPFFTTKPTGQGTGLGLSLSYEIIQQHNGTLDVETQEGEGTEFTVYLPR